MKLNYTVAQFRKDMRMVFNAVDQGADVTIERYDRQYKLVPAFDPTQNILVPPHTDLIPGKSNVKLSEKAMNELKQTKAGKGDNKKVTNLCPHGRAKGLCKQQSCNLRFA